MSDLSFVLFYCSASYPGPWCFYSMAVRESCLRNGNRKEHEIFQQYTLMFNDKRSVSLLHLPFLQYPGAHKFSHRWPQLKSFRFVSFRSASQNGISQWMTISPIKFGNYVPAFFTTQRKSIKYYEMASEKWHSQRYVGCNVFAWLDHHTRRHSQRFMGKSTALVLNFSPSPLTIPALIKHFVMQSESSKTKLNDNKNGR